MLLTVAGNCRGEQCRGRNPTSIENVGLNKTDNTPGHWYYDRKAATISYIPRAGETAATLEATATTATQQELVSLTGTKNVKWEGVHFAYGSWLDASGPKGYIDTQSGYQCQAVADSREGEPPTNIAISKCTNVTVVGCTFSHLGAVYALGADGASQDIIVSNSTFSDLSGGAVKLGKSGERGAAAPDPNTTVADQDRGYLVADNLMTGSTQEYSVRTCYLLLAAFMNQKGKLGTNSVTTCCRAPTLSSSDTWRIPISCITPSTTRSTAASAR